MSFMSISLLLVRILPIGDVAIVLREPVGLGPEAVREDRIRDERADRKHERHVLLVAEAEAANRVDVGLRDLVRAQGELLAEREQRLLARAEIRGLRLPHAELDP